MTEQVEPRRPDLVCSLCGSTEDVVSRLKHIGGYNIDQEVVQCRDEVACWARWDEQHSSNSEKQKLKELL